jgi:hypothetical protein
LNTAACVAVRCSHTLFFQSVACLLTARIHLAAFGRVERKLVAIGSSVDRLYDINLAYMNALAIAHIWLMFDKLTVVWPIIVIA